MHFLVLRMCQRFSSKVDSLAFKALFQFKYRTLLPIEFGPKFSRKVHIGIHEHGDFVVGEHQPGAPVLRTLTNDRFWLDACTR